MAIPNYDPNLLVKDIPWGDKTEIEDAVLGVPPNWDRYRKAHLWYDPKNEDAKAGYKLPFAKMDGGRLTAVRSQLSAAIAAINGARGGVVISPNERAAAYRLAVRYLKKYDPKIQVPELKAMIKSEELDRIESLTKRVTELRGVSVAKSNQEKHLDEDGFPEDMNDPAFVERGEGTPPIWDET